jgi:hypothetical protein
VTQRRANGGALAPVLVVVHHCDSADRRELVRHLARAVGGAVVDDHQLCALDGQVRGKDLLDGLANRRPLVEDGHQYRDAAHLDNRSFGARSAGR